MPLHVPTLRSIAGIAMLAMIAACSDPAPPAPQAEAKPAQHTELRDAIQRPIERAKTVEGDTLDAAEAQRKRIEAEGG